MFSDFLGSGLVAIASYVGGDGNDFVITVLAPAAVMNRFVTYQGSSFGEAVAADKQALLPGETASFSNYTSYDKGITNIVLEVANLPSMPVLSDFEFHVGNSDDVGAWSSLSAQPTISVNFGGGTNGTDLVSLQWPDNSIVNQWVQVRLRATSNTLLSADDVFYFGNAIGETGNGSTDALVNIVDLAATRINQTGFGSADILNDFDFNRDGKVNIVDIALVRTNQSGFTPLKLISPSGSQNRNANSNGSNDNSKDHNQFLVAPFGSDFGQLSFNDNEELTSSSNSMKPKYNLSDLVLVGSSENENGKMAWATNSSDRGKDSIDLKRLDEAFSIPVGSHMNLLLDHWNF